MCSENGMWNRNITINKSGGILALFLLLLLLFTNSFLWPRRYGTENAALNYLGALLLNFVAASTFTILLLNKNVLIRKGSEIFLFSVLFMDIAYLLITGSSFGYYDALNMMNNLHYAGPAAESFIKEFIGAFLITGVCFSFIHGIRKKTDVTLLPKSALIPLATVGFFVLYALSNTARTDVLPSLYRTPLSLAFAAIEARKPTQPRENVSATPDCLQSKHIFLVVDESITGSSLSINGGDSAATPFLNQHQDSLINFGIASSFTNYSAGSNICLISGARMQQLPDNEQRALRQPSIFQYAKAAGYKTYFIDAQTSGGQLQNYLTAQDLKSVDSFLQPAGCTPQFYKRDVVIAEWLAALAKKNEKSFVYVNKAGAHWPYEKSYPPELEKRSDGAKDVKKEYQLAVTWSADWFWERLLKGITGKDSCTIIYTSDHGEFINESGYASAGHGTLYNPNPLEGNVPLLVYDRSNRFHNITQKNAFSHEQIFPTALLLMGFNDHYVSSRYGPSLFNAPEKRRRWFLSGDVFGRSRTYKTYLDDGRSGSKNRRQVEAKLEAPGKVLPDMGF